MSVITSPSEAQKRRFVFINRYYAPDHSATSQILTDLATSLAAAGDDVHVVCAAETYDGATRLAPEETLDGVHVHRVTSGGFGRASLVRRAADSSVLYASMYRRATTLLRRGDILVVKTDPPMLSVPMARAAHRSGAHLVNWLQDLYPEVAAALGVSLAEGVPGRVLSALRNRSLEGAALNVAIGDRMVERLEQAGVAPRRIAVIHNWSDDATIAPVDHADNPLRAAWGLADKFVVGYSGNLGRAHEFETLLAAALTLRDLDDVTFLFVGSGHHVDALRARTQALGLSAAFQFQPYQPRGALSFSLGAADVHWLSLRPELEGLIVPSKFYGIAAAGRATLCVTATDGELARIVDRYLCGLIAAPGDAPRLARHIRALRSDRALCRAMGVRARAMIDQSFSKARALAAWRALLQGPMDA